MAATGGKPHIIRMFRVSKSYGAKHALIDLNLHIRQQEFIFISGPSGAGKTTLLKMMYRGERASQGQILVGGVNLNRIARKKLPALRRKFGIIFQDYKLIPHKTIFDNVALVLECAGMRGRIVKKRVSTVLPRRLWRRCSVWNVSSTWARRISRDSRSTCSVCVCSVRR